MTAHAKQVLDIEKGFWEDASPDFFSKHFADDGVAMMDSMPPFDKASSIEAAKKSKPYHDIVMEEVRIQELTNDCVAINYHGAGKPEGSNDATRAKITSVFVNREGTWQMALTIHQPWHIEDES